MKKREMGTFGCLCSDIVFIVRKHCLCRRRRWSSVWICSRYVFKCNRHFGFTYGSKKITPAGQQVNLTHNMPLGMDISPDKKFMAISSNGEEKKRHLHY